MRTYDDLILEAKARIGYLLDFKEGLERRLTADAAGRDKIKAALREANDELRKLDFMILQKTQLEATEGPPTTIITSREGLKQISTKQWERTPEIYLREPDGSLIVHKSKFYMPGAMLSAAHPYTPTY